MTEKFASLEPDKQERIINAALQEFAEQGYQQASTNRIVEKAGIGKGMLFYYFKSKKELFHYLLEFGTQFITEEFLNQIETEETDFIERYRKTAQCKLKAYTKNPHVFNFLASTFINQSEELSPEWGKKLVQIKEWGYFRLFNNLDTSLFRKDIEPQKAIKLIQWTMDGYEKELIARFQGENFTSLELEPYWEEFYQYLDILRRVFYQNGEGKENDGTAGA